MWTGKFGFDMFTHQRTSLDSPSWMDALMKFRNPPYTVSFIRTSAVFSPHTRCRLASSTSSTPLLRRLCPHVWARRHGIIGRQSALEWFSPLVR
jgi:hypothetical protein